MACFIMRKHKNTSMQPTGLSKLTSNIPARLLPGNDMSGYLWRGKKKVKYYLGN